MKKTVTLFHVLLGIFAAASHLHAQVEDKKFLEEQRRREMDERARPTDDLGQPFLWDAGGWLHAEIIHFDDAPARSDRDLRFLDVRLWGEARIAGNYTAYVRIQSEYTDFNQGDQFKGEDDTYHVARVDQAYVEGDFSSPGRELTVRVGRQFFTLGRGLVYNAVAYGGSASYVAGSFTLRGFAAHSVATDDDIDKSLPDADDSYRMFAGVEGSTLFFGTNRGYFLAMVEHDRNPERPESTTQDWDYNANYVGAGARGTLIGGLGYSCEGVFEFGRSAAAGSTSQEDIEAWAAMVTLDYTLQTPMTPYLLAEYLYGSGDRDRGSVTDVASGNLLGTKDQSFLGFGFVQTGFALFPRLSNIHIFRLGASFHPLESLDAFRQFEIGVFGYYYRKDEAKQPISDPRASNFEQDIGREIDVSVRWRVLSDLGISISYGRFIPGAAYEEQQNRDFISAGITYSF